VDKNLTRIVFASLEAEIYVWLSKLDISTEPKKAQRGKFVEACTKKIKQVYPKEKPKRVQEMVKHLEEYWTIVFKREL
jgi:hypothetical protein